MKLSHWAKKQGITYRTAWEHFRTGKIPHAYKLATGAIIVPDDQDAEWIKTQQKELVRANKGLRRLRRKLDSLKDKE
uniref:Uncharacterized protein n=1 Tax=viral metagenome TaxID=1070528 RepID=A0A6M3JNL5_9ZZZZ